MRIPSRALGVCLSAAVALSLGLSSGATLGCSSDDAARTKKPLTSDARAGADATLGGERAGQDEAVKGPLADAPKQGFVLRVGEGGAPDRVVPDRTKLGKATPLAEAATKKLLARLPALTKETGDEKSFALREGSKPPPRTGATVKGAFPPDKPADVERPKDPGPLEVLRHQPEGDIPIGRNLSVTFSQPMVAVTSHDDLANEAVPVQVTPEMQGKWRWVGTKTLFFEPEVRLPMATEFKATVPAGTTSAVGGKLAKDVTWTFTTPPASVRFFMPRSGPQRRDVTMFVVFDQRVAAEDVLKTIKVEADGKTWPVERVTKDKDGKALALPSWQKSTEDRWLAFRATDLLPVDSAVTVTVGPGTPSAEGPRTSKTAHVETFRTFGPLQLKEHRCGWRDCRPMQPFSLRFTNPLDGDAFDERQVRIEPALPGAQITASGQWINIRGVTKGRTTYKVTIARSLKDTFGQTLGADETVSFEVGSAQSSIGAPDSTMVVLDPAGKPRFTVYTINHDEVRVRLFKVKPGDWDGYLKWRSEIWEDDAPAPPGVEVVDTTVKIDAESDTLAETAIDLDKALTGGLGQVVVMVWAAAGDKPYQKRRNTVTAWVQATKLALDAFVDAEDMVAWVNRLADGGPEPGVEVTLLPQGVTASSGADGVVKLKLPKAPSGRQALVARKGDDLAFLPDSTYRWSKDGRWVQRARQDRLSWVVFDDRQLYRPGEKVRVKGWMRLIEAGPKGDVRGLPASVRTVTWEAKGSRGNELAKGEAKVNAAGGFHLELELPATPNLGRAHISLTAVGASAANAKTTHTFDIQEFRRPEFEAKASASEGPHFVGGSAAASVEASYYAGGPLPGADVNWSVTVSPGYFSPPNQSGFSFGRWTPWWESDGPGGDGGRTQHLAGKTDAAGKHTIDLAFESVDPPRATSIVGNARVTDVNRQALSATTSLLVHPASVYVGMRTPRRFVERGMPLEIEAIVADLDGKRVTGTPIKVTAVRLEWKRIKRDWVRVEVDEQTCAVTSAADPVKCSFETKLGGTYRVRSRVADAEGRANESQMPVWVSGGKRPPQRKLEQEKVELIPSKEEYAPGEVAEILVQAPFEAAQGLVSIRREGFLETRRITIDGSSTTVKVPVLEGHIPNIHVTVDLIGSADRTNAQGAADPKLPKRPAYATGTIRLSVPAAMRRLEVVATPAAEKTEPGAHTKVSVVVKDAQGKPVSGAEVAVVVVDESVLALAGYSMRDPLAAFHPGRGPGVQSEHSRSHVKLATLDDLLAQAPGADGGEGRAMMKMANGAPPPSPAAMAEPEAEEKAGDDEFSGGDAGGDSPIALRKNFDALAVFAPEVGTDAAGRAVVDVKLPDNLTRYRVMVYAVAGEKQAGTIESAITARLPLMVRPSAPRFLNFGDRFELPVVVQNQTDAPMVVQVAVQATNAVLEQGAGRTVTVPANDRVEVRFPAAAALAGTARFQMAAASGPWADAAKVELPVWTPATTEAFATYGEVDAGGTVQPVKLPGAVVTEFGGIEVTTSSTQLQALTDAVLYLVQYPYDCSEQVSSRMMGIAALKDVLSAFEAEGLPDEKALLAIVDADMKRLQKLQNSNGGWGFWRRGMDSWPYLTIHVTHALTRAKAKGFEVPKRMLDQAHGYLKQIERHFPPYYSKQTRQVLTAYALYVRQRLGDRDVAKAKSLISDAGLKGLGLEAVGWLYPVVAGEGGSPSDAAAIRKHINNRVTETAAGAHFASSYSDGAHLLLHSNRRADAILLEGLIGDQKASDLIPKIVRGLLAHRVKGRWGNTQENAWVLLALDRYFNTYENVTPDFIARVWLGDGFAGEHAFKGRTTERHAIEIPMAWLAKLGTGAHDLVIAKSKGLSGKADGRLYYRIGMRYAPASLDLKPSEHGFTVTRTYEAVDDPKEVARGTDGVWTVKAGARVRVRVSMVAPTRRYHVALVDPMPAGFESLNTALKGTEAIPADKGASSKSGGDDDREYWRWWGPWYEHTNLRDERAEAFAATVWAGVHEYTYVARATTPGHFVVPPAKAEEMYHPETFGRSGSDKVVVQ